MCGVLRRVRMASSEKFCLRWNDFESNVSTAFRDLREEKDFFDVTLACEDSQLQAHKVIIAACSPFFREVLRRNPHQHPLLYLKGVKHKVRYLSLQLVVTNICPQELLCVLNFMYQGEVNVAQEELNTFLAVAEDLRVKGLTQGNSNSDKPKSEAKQPRGAPPPPSRESDIPPPKRQRPAPVVTSASYQDDDEIQEVVPVKSEPSVADNSGYNVGDGQQGTVALEDAYNEESYDYGQYGEGGYDDGSGMIDPNTGMPLVGADGNKGKNSLLLSSQQSLHFSSEVPGLSGVNYIQPTSILHLLSTYWAIKHTKAHGVNTSKNIISLK